MLKKPPPVIPRSPPFLLADDEESPFVSKERFLARGARSE